MPPPPFTHKEQLVGATLAAALIRDDSDLRAELRAHVATACGTAGLLVPSAERQEQLVLLAISTLFGPMPGGA